MRTLSTGRPSLLVLHAAVAACLILPATLQGQQPSSNSNPPSTDDIRDLPLTAEERQRYLGTYAVALPDPQQAPLQLRIFEAEGELMGEFMGNDPTRMLHQGAHVFRPQAAVEFEATFLLSGDRATGISIESPAGPMKGERIESGSYGGAKTGVLFDDLAALDKTIFDAAFSDCNSDVLNAHLAEDIEFYHDIAGFREGDQVRESFRELAASCAAGRGPRRELVDGSLSAYPINNYGAVQTGSHRFVQPDGSPTIIAQFVHLWQRHGESWRLTRVLSFDHRPDTGSPSAE